jgi:hypothetical protein
MNTILDSQLRRPIVSHTPKTTLRLPQDIFDVWFKTNGPQKEAIEENLVDDVEDALESSDLEEVIAVELSDKLEIPRPSSSARKRELLKDNMEMLRKELSMLDTEDISESSDEEEDDFDDNSVDWF